MKKIFYFCFSITVAILAGCARMGTAVGPDNGQTGKTAIGTFKIIPDTAGVLGKKMDLPQATVLLVSWDGSTNWDSVALTGKDTVSLSHSFSRGIAYTVIFVMINPAYTA